MDEKALIKALVNALELAEKDLRLAFSTNKDSYGYSKGLEAVVDALAKSKSHEANQHP